MEPEKSLPIESQRHAALRVALSYAVLAGVWILFSDRALSAVVWDARLLTNLQTYKGWAFVLFTAALLYLERQQAHQRIERHVQQLNALRSIDQAIASSLELSKTLDVLLLQVYSQLEVDAAQVFLLDVRREMLHCVALIGFRYPATGIEMPLDCSCPGRTLLQGKVIHLTRYSAEFSARCAGELHGEDFVEYYGLPLIVKNEIKGLLEIFCRRRTPRPAGWLKFLEALAGQAAIAVENALLLEALQRRNEELSQAYEATLEGWVRALDLRDKETEGHTQRVTRLTLELARRMEVPEDELVHIRRGALLHDIGKIGVSDTILLKRGPLTPEETGLMRLHPELAQRMLAPIEYLHPALDIPYCHHEQWNGNGYPRGLKGEEIPLAARIFAVVDVWDAMLSPRPYHGQRPAEEVLNYIRAQAGAQFDPRVVEAFLQPPPLPGLASSLNEQGGADVTIKV